MTPLVRLGNAYSKIECDHDTLFELDRELAVEVPGAFFARRHRPGWDGFWHPLNIMRGEFPTGLLARVRKFLPLAQVKDERQRPPTLPFRKDMLQGVTLADHQEKAVRLILEGNGLGTLGISVAGGKTEQGIAVACHVQGLCVWITHRKDLLYQTTERIKWRTGETAVMIGDGAWGEITDRTKFLVVMPQTALLDPGLFAAQVKSASVMVADEAHTASSANLWFKIAMSVPAFYRVGLTGTPFTDPIRDMRLEASTGPVLIRIKASEMAELGWAVPAQVIYHRLDNPSLPGADYQEARRTLIEENPARNAMIVELAMDAAREGKRCLVICDTIRHVRLLGEILRGENVRSQVLTGKYSSQARIQAKKEFRSGVLEVLLSSPILDMGVDLPELEVVVIAAGGKSASRFIQRCGRALRKSAGKDKATIHDFWDTGSRYTLRHSVSRLQACRREGFEVVGTPEIARN